MPPSVNSITPLQLQHCILDDIRGSLLLWLLEAMFGGGLAHLLRLHWFLGFRLFGGFALLRFLLL